MEKREKVIKGLECCSKGAVTPYIPTIRECADCPYSQPEIPCTRLLAKEAIELLKEQQETIWALEIDLDDTLDVMCEYAEKVKAQEPIRPRIGIIHNKDGSTSYFLHCPFDGTVIDVGDRFCRKCGRSVKWDAPEADERGEGE